MTRYFNKLSRLAIVAILAGATVPQAASAEGHNHGGGRSFKSFRTGGSSQFNGGAMKPQSPPQTKVFKPSSNLGTFSQTSKPLKLSTGRPNSGIVPRSKITPVKRWQDNILVGSDKFTPKPGKFPTGPIVADPLAGGGKPPKGPFDPFPGGPIVVNPNPGGGPKPTPPPIDPGSGGGGQPYPPQDHCHPKCPWPIFWPVYGNNNYWNNGYYNGPAYCPPSVVVSEEPVVTGGVTPVVTPAPGVAAGGTVDLVLEDVQYIEPATMLVGPAYRVKFRNQGMQAAGKFRVALVASLGGQVTDKSPMAVVDVTGLASGESGEVTVRLPRTAMQLSNDAGQPVAFTHLLVAADFDNLVAEAEKTNNIAIIERTQLEVAAR